MMKPLSMSHIERRLVSVIGADSVVSGHNRRAGVLAKADGQGGRGSTVAP
jgi:hypothetical protein